MIVLDDLGVRHGSTIALRHADLTFAPGAPTLVLGRNGAGKTSMLTAMAGLVRPFEGTVEVSAGMDVSFLPEDRGVYGRLSVRRHLELFAELARVPVRRTTDHWIETLGLDGLVDRPVGQLSKGNQQKVQLACAMVDDPDCLLLDEPYSGLDPLTLKQVQALLEDYSRDHVVVITAHDVDQLDSRTAHVVFVRGGRIVESGPLDRVRRLHGGAQLRLPDSPALAEWLAGQGFRTQRDEARGQLRVEGLDFAAARDCLSGMPVDPTEFSWTPMPLSELFVSIMRQEDES